MVLIFSYKHLKFRWFNHFKGRTDSLKATPTKAKYITKPFQNGNYDSSKSQNSNKLQTSSLKCFDAEMKPFNCPI